MGSVSSKVVRQRACNVERKFIVFRLMDSLWNVVHWMVNGRLTHSGLRRIEVGQVYSSKWIPRITCRSGERIANAIP